MIIKNKKHVFLFVMICLLCGCGKKNEPVSEITEVVSEPEQESIEVTESLSIQRAYYPLVEKYVAALKDSLKDSSSVEILEVAVFAKELNKDSNQIIKSFETKSTEGVSVTLNISYIQNGGEKEAYCRYFTDGFSISTDKKGEGTLSAFKNRIAKGTIKEGKFENIYGGNDENNWNSFFIDLNDYENQGYKL